ncbi:hypothetical protein BGZ83_006533, partial [Gryganskiella cystojenkinii]
MAASLGKQQFKALIKAMLYSFQMTSNLWESLAAYLKGTGWSFFPDSLGCTMQSAKHSRKKSSGGSYKKAMDKYPGSEFLLSIAKRLSVKFRDFQAGSSLLVEK